MKNNVSLVIAMFLLGLFFSKTAAQEQISFYFNTNEHILERKEISRLEVWISENKTSKILGIYGYTDEDGSVGFNDTLAQRRVNHVFELVKNIISIRDDFKTRSFGKLHQQSQNKAENRRVTLFYLEAKDLHLENEILGITPEPLVVAKPLKQFPEAIIITNPNGTTSEFELDVNFMRQVDEAPPGTKLKLENLNFVLNTFAVVNESRGKLYELLIVLQQNPALSIEIHGHLCCNPNDRNDLSTQRAKAVYLFLLQSGIQKSRLSYKGFGSNQPLFPLPEENEAQRAANRRVEIQVTKN
jgi:outer membrane protein OmpA-like peptidoglycan-associated protein